MFRTKLISALLVTTGLAMATHSAVAQSKGYAGVNIAVLDYSVDVLPGEEASLTALYGKLGAQFHENFSAEFRLGFGVGDDDLDVAVGGATAEVEVSLEEFFGGYVRGGVQAGENFYPYLIAGYTRGTLEGEAFGIEVDDSESDFSYGIGTDIKFTDTLGGNFEYMNYLDKDGAEIDGYAVGLTWLF